MITIETMRERIVETTLYNRECIGFGDSGTIYWTPGANEWLLLDMDNTGKKDWTFGSLEELVECISDEDIQEYYEDEIANEYDDEDEEEAV